MAFFKLVGAWPRKVRAGLEDRLILGHLPRALYSLHGEGFRVQAFWFGGSSGLLVQGLGSDGPVAERCSLSIFLLHGIAGPLALQESKSTGPWQKTCGGTHVRSGPAKWFAQILEGWASSAT